MLVLSLELLLVLSLELLSLELLLSLDLAVLLVDGLLPPESLPPPLAPYPSAYQPPPLSANEVVETRRSSASAPHLGQVVSGSADMRWTISSSSAHAPQR